jgi:hypothetical protein
VRTDSDDEKRWMEGKQIVGKKGSAPGQLDDAKAFSLSALVSGLRWSTCLMPPIVWVPGPAKKVLGASLGMSWAVATGAIQHTTVRSLCCNGVTVVLC